MRLTSLLLPAKARVSKALRIDSRTANSSLSDSSTHTPPYPCPIAAATAPCSLQTKSLALGAFCLPAPSQQQHLCPTQTLAQQLPHHLLDDERAHEGVLICKAKG